MQKGSIAWAQTALQPAPIQSYVTLGHMENPGKEELAATSARSLEGGTPSLNVAQTYGYDMV